jgi:hypothetical protein
VSPTTCYAVTSGEYSDYQVVAVYRRREDAEARARANNELTRWLDDGHGSVGFNQERESRDDLRVEEFDYYEGEPLSAPLEEGSSS